MQKSVKIKKFEQDINRIISGAISESNNQNFNLVTVTESDLTNDYSYVTIYVTDLNENKEVIDELNKAKGYFKSFLADKLNIRKVPEPTFKWDTSLEYANHIEKILKEKL